MKNNSQKSVLFAELVQKHFLIRSQHVAVLKQGTRYTTSGNETQGSSERVPQVHQNYQPLYMK